MPVPLPPSSAPPSACRVFQPSRPCSHRDIAATVPNAGRRRSRGSLGKVPGRWRPGMGIGAQRRRQRPNNGPGTCLGVAAPPVGPLLFYRTVVLTQPCHSPGSIHWIKHCTGACPAGRRRPPRPFHCRGKRTVKTWSKPGLFIGAAAKRAAHRFWRVTHHSGRTAHVPGPNSRAG